MDEASAMEVFSHSDPLSTVCRHYSKSFVCASLFDPGNDLIVIIVPSFSHEETEAQTS